MSATRDEQRTSIEPPAPNDAEWLSDEHPEETASLAVMDIGSAIVAMRAMRRTGKVLDRDVAAHHIANLERALLAVGVGLGRLSHEFVPSTIDSDDRTQGAQT